jgi:hypothetical protein
MKTFPFPSLNKVIFMLYQHLLFKRVPQDGVAPQLDSVVVQSKWTAEKESRVNNGDLRAQPCFP